MSAPGTGHLQAQALRVAAERGFVQVADVAEAAGIELTASVAYSIRRALWGLDAAGLLEVVRTHDGVRAGTCLIGYSLL